MSNWIRLTDPALSEHYESEKLQEFGLYYCTLLSYQKVSALITTRCGSTRLSDQRLYHLVEEKAGRLSREQAALIESVGGEATEVAAVSVDPYDEKGEEVIWLADGVCVSEQKAQRDKQAKGGKKRTTTEMVMLERGDGSYKTLCAGEGIEREQLYRAEVIREYGKRAARLPVVAISDGARSIKNETKRLFGTEVCHILDWYHLESKLYRMMSQIAVSRGAKTEAVDILREALWQGETGKAIGYLQSMKVKNQDKQAELLGYLEKNRDYIINYERRRQTGKIIGSGRMEKQNDVVVAHRQKRKGMSWSKEGSLNLTMVTVHFNQRTNYLQ